MEPDNFTEAETKEKEPSSAEMVTVIEQDPLAGTLLDGRYAIKRKLGQGGFGSLYLASDEKMMSRPVVAKILHVENLRDHGTRHHLFVRGQIQRAKTALAQLSFDGVTTVQQRSGQRILLDDRNHLSR